MASENTKLSEEQIKELGIKLLTREELGNIWAGDFIDCDVLHQSLLHAGFKARYKNIYSDINGFLAEFYIGEYYLGAVEGSSMGHMVKAWKGLPDT